MNTCLSLRIHVLRVRRLRLIWAPSFSLAPSACVCDALSLPAKSTKFCTKKITVGNEESLLKTLLVQQEISESFHLMKKVRCEMKNLESVSTRLATNEVAGLPDAIP